MKTPDITRAQIAALLTFAGGNAVAWGVLTSPPSQKIVALASTAIAIAWKLADAIVRHGRARVAALNAAEQLALEAAVKPSSTS